MTERIYIPCNDGRLLLVEARSLEEFDFREMNLHRAILERTVMTGSRFDRVHAWNLNAELALCDNTSFIAAKLTNSWFNGASLRHSDFSESELYSVEFRGCSLERSTFRSARLSGAIFAGANLDGASFESCDLDGVMFDGALFTQATRWPDNFEPSERGLVEVAHQSSFAYVNGAPNPKFWPIDAAISIYDTIGVEGG